MGECALDGRRDASQLSGEGGAYKKDVGAMTYSKSLLPLAALASLVAPVAVWAEPAPASDAAVKSDNASIPFANRGGVRDWRAQGTDSVYFQDNHGQWYLAKLMGSASDLSFTDFIGIDANPDGSLDKFSAIYVRGQKYPFESVVKVDGPPAKRAKSKPRR